MSSISPKPWSVGWHDRGNGHGDFGILDANGKLIAEIIETVPEKGMTIEEATKMMCSKDNADDIILACNSHQEMFEICEEALRRLTLISNHLNGGVSKENIKDAYNTAYPGTLRELLKKIRPDTPHGHCELCGFHTHEAKDCPYKE